MWLPLQNSPPPTAPSDKQTPQILLSPIWKTLTKEKKKEA